MSSLKADFDELRERIRHGRELGHASFEPIYYLVFPPDQILEGCPHLLHCGTNLGITQRGSVLATLGSARQIVPAGLAAHQQNPN